MECEKKVFFSDITRVGFEQKNNLYELLNITPAKPIPVEISKNTECVFEPKCDKYYVPKKKSKMKVRTVREIRNLFEQDNFCFIVDDMQKQQGALLSKIRNGSSTDDSTKNMAKKLLMADNPISRTAWQMLTNINPDRNVNATQFVLYNGRRIRVVGSKGGRHQFICNHDLGKNNIEDIKKKCFLEKYTRKKNGLLRNSLNIKFKPGPLRKKKDLDVSHQKYHMGPVELVKLPKPALDIQPTYGMVVEPIITSFLNKLRVEDGTITEKWAEFAVSVLGTVQKNNIVQEDKDCCVTFNLSYKCGQDRILMRRSVSKTTADSVNFMSPKYMSQQTESDYMVEIQETLNQMLDSVEISLKQDCMYSVENEPPQTIPALLDEFDASCVKDKPKKKYGELDRLAVTVIQLPGLPKRNPSKHCGKSYCNLGCICDSLNCTYKIKQHCGSPECMFGCKCELSKYKDIELLDYDCAELMPGLMKLDNEINANLAKEEQKFHQTVVVSGEKSILLKSKKRTSKSTMKYAEFCSSIRLKNEQEPKKILTIVSKKLYCGNIETWCMIHNLYKCFCKGRFTETSAFNTTTPISNSTTDLENSIELSDHVNVATNLGVREIIKPRPHRTRHSSEKIKSVSISEANALKEYYSRYNSSKTCARINGYGGRKYEDYYYKITNQKILEMEKNDTKLHKKIIKIIQNTTNPQTSVTTPIILSDTSTSDDASVESQRIIKCIDNVDDKFANYFNTNYKNNFVLDKSNQSCIEPIADPELKLDEVAELDSAKDTYQLEDEDSLTYSGETNIPFEISGDIYKPIKGHLITQEFLTPWIAKSYKNYKNQLNNGKSTLEPPKRGKIILHLWECLLNRYRSRRNVFLTTTRRPFRIYIATDTSKPFFKDCINIDAIRFADLHKYPCLIKKLLTNASNKDYFCILGGWKDCWEIIGSVKKNESGTDDRPSYTELSNTESVSQDSDFAPENWALNDQNDTADTPNLPREVIKKVEMEMYNLERSKWFFLKIENDFTEIYCHKKGFYVEREKILHAIRLARITRKTVVINKQTCTEITNIPFGIYALPDTTDYCAIVGPYEITEPLGFEIVKSSFFAAQKCTKGYWITTNKVDNIKVLDDPLSFLPSTAVHKELVQNITSNYTINDDTVRPSTSQKEVKSYKRIQKHVSLNSRIDKSPTIEKTISKIVKPIKIRRTNGFYHLSSKNNILKKVSPSTSTSFLDVKTLKKNTKSHILINDPNCNTEESNACVESGADQIKITSVYSEREDSSENYKIPGMHILNPEEINKKIVNFHDGNNFYSDAIDDAAMGKDIDQFLSFARTEPAPTTSAGYTENLHLDPEDNDTSKLTDVWIQCSTIHNLGWIRGKINNENLLSIDFPGFKPMHFYKEKQAFGMINRVLSKTIKIPNHIKIKWKVLTVSAASKCLKGALLNVNSLADNYEITENGLTKTVSLRTTRATRLIEDGPNHTENVIDTDLIDGLEETSKKLEDEGVLLFNETKKRQTEIIQTLSVPEELKSGMSQTLQGLMTMNEELLDK